MSGQDRPRRGDGTPRSRDKWPSNRRVVDEARKSPRPPRSHAVGQRHSSPSDRTQSTVRQTTDDWKESKAESPSKTNSNAPKSLFQRHADAPKSFSNSRVFTLDQRSQRMMVKELESPSTSSDQQQQPSLRVRRPMGRGRGIVRRGGDSTPGFPVGVRNKASTSTGSDTVVPSLVSEVKEIAPFDQRAPDVGDAAQAPTSTVGLPCKTQVSSSRPLQQAPLVPAQEEEGSSKKSKEKESILGDPPASAVLGKPKRYSSQRQKTAVSSHEELVDEPGKGTGEVRLVTSQNRL